MKNNISSNTEFGKRVENLIASGDISVMDALVHLMESEGLDEESISKLVRKNPVIKAKLENESRVLNLIKFEKEAELPI